MVTSGGPAWTPACEFCGGHDSAPSQEGIRYSPYGRVRIAVGPEPGPGGSLAASPSPSPVPPGPETSSGRWTGHILAQKHRFNPRSRNLLRRAFPARMLSSHTPARPGAHSRISHAQLRPRLPGLTPPAPHSSRGPKPFCPLYLASWRCSSPARRQIPRRFLFVHEVTRFPQPRKPAAGREFCPR